MTPARRLVAALACAAAVLVPAGAAQAAVPGINVSHLSNNGDPYVAAPGNLPGDPSDTARTWADLEQSGAKTVRKDAKRAFRVRHRFQKRGVWRVTGRYVPRKGFKGAKAKPTRLKVR
jgi:hypothetical protein